MFFEQTARSIRHHSLILRVQDFRTSAPAACRLLMMLSCWAEPISGECLLHHRPFAPAQSCCYQMSSMSQLREFQCVFFGWQMRSSSLKMGSWLFQPSHDIMRSCQIKSRHSMLFSHILYHSFPYYTMGILHSYDHTASLWWHRPSFPCRKTLRPWLIVPLGKFRYCHRYHTYR